MLLDGHIHIDRWDAGNEDFYNRLKESGIDGGLIISLPPNSFDSNTYSAKERLDNLFCWKGTNTNLYPFYWIDPLESDALDQVELARSYGVSGFKIISKTYPDDERSMRVYRAIARINKPILFHSGILWDGAMSARYNRPAEFEALIEIEGLRFSLAHVSWPWCDECIAVYGKFLNAFSKRPDMSVEMFIDITPGTPKIYREEVLTKLFSVGYDVESNIIFGTDCSTGNYNTKWAKEWINRDNEIYSRLSITKEVREKIYSENLKRFLGITDTKIEKKIPLQGE